MVDESKFGTFAESGLTIERDQRSKARLLKLASSVLAKKRLGTELDDHLSDDTKCQRKAVLDRFSALKKVERVSGFEWTLLPKSINPIVNVEEDVAYSRTQEFTYKPSSLIKLVNGQLVIYFGLGHSLQDFLLGDIEVQKWNPEFELWYSPDGAEIFGDGDMHEVKSTRRGAAPTKGKKKKADPTYDMYEGYNENQNWTIEEKLYRVNNGWFEYMLAVMKMEGLNEYILHLMWIIPGEMESFRITATDELIERNWDTMLNRRLNRRNYMAEGKLPGVASRMYAGECTNCEYLGREPCASEVPVQNAKEGVV
jgi:hypothetical protein